LKFGNKWRFHAICKYSIANKNAYIIIQFGVNDNMEGQIVVHLRMKDHPSMGVKLYDSHEWGRQCIL
jgi:hypothetical protein